MKKEVLFFVCISAIFLILASGVFAQNNANNIQQNISAGQGNVERERIISQIKENIREKIKTGEELTIPEKRLVIRALNNNRLQLKARNFIAHTEFNLTEEQEENVTKLKAMLKNGRFAEIKIMPDTAAERALERLRLKVCNETNNCTIELKEVGKGNLTRAAYELKAIKRARLFWIFRTKMRVQSQIDAENGEVIQAEKPWWAFLASEEE